MGEICLKSASIGGAIVLVLFIIPYVLVLALLPRPDPIGTINYENAKSVYALTLLRNDVLKMTKLLDEMSKQPEKKGI